MTGCTHDRDSAEQVMSVTERPVALIVDASFDNDRFTIDTTTIDGQRAVVMQMKDGVRFLTPAETLALSRALLSRLAYVGFPPERAESGESMADRLRRVEAGVERDDSVQQGVDYGAQLLVTSPGMVGVSALEPGIGEVNGAPQVISDLAHEAESTGQVSR